MSERRIEYVSIDAVKPAPRNPKDHDLGALAESVERFGFTEPALMDERTGRLVAGHGRIETLRSLRKAGKKPPKGVSEDWKVPVVRGWASRTDAEADAYLVASNRLTELGGWHDDQLTELLSELASKDALGGTGYDNDDVDKLLGAIGEEGQKYTAKIVTPVYTPTREMPPVSDLYDTKKTEELVREINRADISDDERKFLLAAAERHTVFNYRNIAEFYAHAEQATQRLFEKSALVVIDYGAAIENGFVHLVEDVMEEAADAG